MTRSDMAVLDVMGSRGITLVRGSGASVWDDEGRRYIDCVSSNGAAILGHAHPHVTAAVVRQAGELSSVSGAFSHPQKSRLAGRLLALAPEGLERAWFCNSGTESIEAAIKLARAATGRTRIVAAKRGFHGRSFGAMSVSFQPKLHELFAPGVGDVDFVAFNKTHGLSEALDERTAAVVVELVQGEGGVHVAEKDFIDELVRVCRSHGILLIVDEVQTGFGRTGTLFACEHYGVSPDIMCLAKGIGAGFPMGAILVKQGLEFPPGSHGSTFGGNPLACAVANAVLDVVTADGFLDGVRDKSAELRARLDLPLRGRGLMIGIPLRSRARPIVDRLAARGVLALTAGKKVLRLLPPLIVTGAEIEKVADAVSHEAEP